MYGDGDVGFVEDHAVVADAETEQPLEVAAERLDATGASFGVTMDGFEDVQCGFLLDRTDFSGTLGRKRIFFTPLLNRPCCREPGPS
jgi:hypothetical protein